jgi:hypothetical protein
VRVKQIYDSNGELLLLTQAQAQLLSESSKQYTRVSPCSKLIRRFYNIYILNEKMNDYIHHSGNKMDWDWDWVSTAEGKSTKLKVRAPPDRKYKSGLASGLE